MAADTSAQTVSTAKPDNQQTVVAVNDKTSGTPTKNEQSDSAKPHFTIGVTDRDGKEIPADKNGFSDPTAKEACGICFDIHINKDISPTTVEMELYRDLSKVEHALQELYLWGDRPNESRFRPYFVRLYYLARLILEGDVDEGEGGKKIVGKPLSTDAGKAEVAAIVDDLIEDEAPRIKNGHLRELGRSAGKFSLAFLGVYVVLTLFSGGPSETKWLVSILQQLKVQPAAAANFMMLWVGTFVGVCLSYAIRTHSFSLADLTRPDSDYLAPEIRLALAGAFAMLLAMLAVVGIGELEFGSLKLSQIATKPMLAFVVGAVLGISEQKLSGTVEKRVGDLFGKATK